MQIGKGVGFPSPIMEEATVLNLNERGLIPIAEPTAYWQVDLCLDRRQD
jgi:hypothetical protein